MRVIVNALVLTHLMPMVPVAWGLRLAGHDVLVVGDADVARAAGRAGLPSRRVGPADGGAERWSRPLVAKSPFAVAGSGSKGPTEEPPWAQMGQRWLARLDTYIDEYLELARVWRPDLIITDPLEWGGLVVGGALGVPVVVHRWGLDNMSSSLLKPGKLALHELCVRLGSPDGLPDPVLVVDPCPPSVQSPNVTPAEPVRFVPYNGTATLPDWVLGPRPERRVFVSLGAWGTGRLAEQGKLDSIVDSIAAAVHEVDEVEAVLFLEERFRETLGPLPATVRVADPLPVNLCLPYGDAIIHHGGSGTALTAFCYGVPQLVLAQDGPLLVPNAERVEASGGGRGIVDERERDDPAAIGKALGEILTEERFREGADRIRREMAAMPSPGLLGDLLEGIALGRV
ncbi:nucleotide disphospho-sugar-binding domain-containing protein [Kitasatospora xanthocidica]|uniref:nucleotide disphospho-sugar-binding domain-containing protein n=1 Tax=Kitasatospora xanthocidica TaxID=83382 RepID=UPI0036EFEB8F